MADDQSTVKSRDTDAAAEQIAENIERNPAGARPAGTGTPATPAPGTVVVQTPPANVTVEGDLKIESPSEGGNDNSGDDSNES